MLIIFTSLLIISSCSNTGNPDSVSSYKTANTLYIKGETSKALTILEAIEIKDSSFVQAAFLSGKIYYLLGNTDMAEEKLTSVIEKKPAHIRSGKWLCRIYISEKRYADAEKLLYSLFDMSADDPELLIFAGKLRKNEGKYLEAIEFYKKAFLFEDKLIDAHLDIAEIYTLFGIREKSLIHLEKAASVGGENHELYGPVRSVIKSIDQP